jgi:hypothetical protein
VKGRGRAWQAGPVSSVRGMCVTPEVWVLAWHSFSLMGRRLLGGDSEALRVGKPDPHDEDFPIPGARALIGECRESWLPCWRAGRARESCAACPTSGLSSVLASRLPNWACRSPHPRTCETRKGSFVSSPQVSQRTLLGPRLFLFGDVAWLCITANSQAVALKVAGSETSRSNSAETPEWPAGAH